MMNRNLLSSIIIALFIGLPLVLFFQNCGGGGSSGGGSSSGPGAGQNNSNWPYKISGPLTAGGSVDLEMFDLNADGSRVVFLADREVADKLELYIVHRDGSNLTKLSGG